MAEAPDVLLDPGEVAGHLQARGVAQDAEVEVLEGGVSSAVFLVTTPEHGLVVKSALPRLRVAQEWYADPARTATEHEALRHVGRLAPGAVPGVVDYDPDANVLVIEAAPAGWRTWKHDLLAGVAHPPTAARLGVTAAAFHAVGDELAETLPLVHATDSFAELRGHPYFTTTGQRLPEHAERLAGLRRWVEEDGVTLVHGDLSPKNVLAGDDGAWLIDWEAAHRGRPEFDVAFLLCHLLLKTVHRPDAADGYRVCATAFLDAYAADADPATGSGTDTRPGTPLSVLVGALVLSRVHGRSPAEYLPEGATAHDVGTELLCERAGLAEAFALASKEAR
jgi:aminoglycoside phosphotransferase (APT) family kinase protein